MVLLEQLILALYLYSLIRYLINKIYILTSFQIMDDIETALFTVL